MKPEFKGQRNRVYRLRQRLEKIGLLSDDYFASLLELALSPIQEDAAKFTAILEQELSKIEFNQAMYDNEKVPELNPDHSIVIGYTLSGKPFRLLLSDLIKHILICGCSGSGKTTLIHLIVSSLAGLFRMILIDHKDESLRFVKHIPDATYIPLNQQRWNCLAGAGNQRAYIRYVATLLARLMALLPVTANAMQAKLLPLCADVNHLPSISDLASIFIALMKQDARSSLLTASRGFADLSVTMGDWATVRQGHWPFNERLLNVIPLKDCPAAFEHFYVSLLFKQLADMASAGGHTTKLHQLVIFDEGRNFFGKEMESASGSGRTNLATDILTKMRSYGLGLVIGTQSLVKTQSTVIDNAGTVIVFRTNSEMEAKAACRLLGWDESRYMELITLEVGMAWVRSPQCLHPVKIKIPFSDLGDYPRESEITRQMQPIWQAWDAHTIFSPTKTEAEETLNFQDILGETGSSESDKPTPSAESEDDSAAAPSPASKPTVPAPENINILADYYSLLRSCVANPTFGVTTHYRVLGWGSAKGDRIKTKLLELNWVEDTCIRSPKGGRPKKCLKLTIEGKGVFNHECT